MTDEDYVQQRFRNAKPFEDGHGLRGPDPLVVRNGMTQGASGVPHNQQVDIPDVPAASSPHIDGSTAVSSSTFRAKAVVIDPGSGFPTTATKTFLTR